MGRPAIAFAILLAAPLARADTDSEEPPAPPASHAAAVAANPEDAAGQALAIDHERDPHWVGEVGLRFGGSSINGVDNGTVDELLFAGGLHLDRMTFLGEYGVSMVHHEATGLLLTGVMAH